MSTVFCCFLQNDNEIMAQHWLNKAAAKVAPKTNDGTPPKIHVELFFPDEAGNENDLVSGRACSIHYNGKVFMTRKRFSRKQWSFRSIPTNKDQYDAVVSYCEAAVGCRFNHLGYFLQPVLSVDHAWPETWFGMKKRYYCSEICVEALKAGGVLHNSVKSQIHPQHLFAMLKDETDAACVRDVSKMDLLF